MGARCRRISSISPALRGSAIDVGAAFDHHVLFAGCRLGLSYGGLDSLGDEDGDVPPFLTIVSAGRWVTMKHGAWKVGSSPQGPMPRYGHARHPTISAPMVLK